MVRLSEKQQRDLLIAVGLGDFLVGGKLTAVSKNALMATIRALKPVAVSEAKGLTRLAARGVVGAARIAPRAAMAAARTNPYAVAATLAYMGYIHRDEIEDVAESVGAMEAPGEREALQRSAAIDVQRGLIGGPSPVPEFIGGAKRKVSKANKAVKEGMKILKAGGKAISGTVAGKLPTGAFKIATKAAGLANPKTKSKPGKGKSIINKLARRLKKWW